MKTLALVSCGKSKLEYQAKAKDLYTGQLFKKARNNAETKYDGWYILSALHGLVDPETELDPYDYTLISKSKEEIQKWSSEVFNNIHKIISADTQIHIYAGKEYRKFLKPLLEEAGYKVSEPLRGLGIGQQLAWYKKQQEGVIV